MKAFKKQEGVKWYICAWKKRCTVQDFIWTGFRFFDQIWTKLGPNLEQIGPNSCTHYIAEKFDKSQKRILLITFCFVFLFSSWFLWFSTFFLSHSYFLMILRIQHIRFGGGIREIQGGFFLFLTLTIFLYMEFSAQKSNLQRKFTWGVVVK